MKKLKNWLNDLVSASFLGILSLARAYLRYWVVVFKTSPY